MKSIIICFLSILFLSQFAHAQIETQKIESLKQELLIVKTDTGKINLLFKIGESLWFNRKIPEAIDFLKQTISLSESKKYFEHQCNALLLLGHAYMRMEKYSEALTALQNSMACSQKNNQQEHIPKVHQAFSTLYNLLGDPNKAIENGLKAAEGYEASPLEKINVQSIFAWLDIGRIFMQQNQYEKALIYFNKGLKKAKDAKKSYLAKGPKLCIAEIYFLQKKFTESKSLYKQVIEDDRVVGGAEPTMDGLNGLGNIAIKEKKFSGAISFYRAAMDTAINRHFIIAADGFSANLGYAFLLNNQKDSAIKYFSIALAAAVKGKDMLVQQKVYSYMAEMEIMDGNFSKAVQYQAAQKNITDSLYNVGRARAVNNIEILYETEKKEKDILKLKGENDEQEILLIKRNRLIGVGLLAVVALTVILILYYFNVRHRQKLALTEKEMQDSKIKFLHEQQQVVSLQSMLNGQETERTRIAKDLHDGLGGLFSTIKMYFSTLGHEQENLKTDPLFAKSNSLIDTASIEVRRIAHNMMPEVLMKLGLNDAIKDMCNNISAGKLLLVTFQSYGLEKRLNGSTEIMLYRIVQELLNNIIKHANATEAIVQFNKSENRLHVTVEDNGRGFNMQEVDDKNHAGLDTIKSRVTYLNGSISIDSQQELGTTVMMDFLLNETE